MTKIEIYTKAYCPYCHRAKKHLDGLGATYQEISVDIDAVAYNQMLERSEGRRTVPQIFINGRGIGGCDDLLALDRQGKLAGLLSEGAT